MLRLSRRTLFIVPNSTSPELPLFLSTKEHHATPAVGDVYQRVMDFDHRGLQNTFSSAPRASSDCTVAQRYFGGSVMGAATTAAGVGLFVLTFAYNVGKPVVDAHREYFSKLGLKGEEDSDSAQGEGDTPSPVEEFDDAVVEEGEEGE